MSNDLKSNGEHAGGANNDFPKFAPGDNADKVLSASYQNKLIAGVERANRKTYGSGVIDFGPVSLQKGQRRAPESGNRIRVRLDYPYRAPMGAVVGVDFPILEESIRDKHDLVNFLNDPVTTYSCTKNQYRHHNRIAILEQELLPGQTGWAVISGLAKTFWLSQYPANANTGSDAMFNLPIRNTNSNVDDYRHLGIASAAYDASALPSQDDPDNYYGSNGGGEHDYSTINGHFVWQNRSRPWWLFPVPRGKSNYESDTETDFESYDTPLPYEQRVASSLGRVTGISGTAVPSIDCSSGSSFVRCEKSKWALQSTTCGTACSSWPVIESWIMSYQDGLDDSSPCTDGDVKEIHCEPDYPNKEWAWNMSGIKWIAGEVFLGNPASQSIVDALPGSDKNLQYASSDPFRLTGNEYRQTRNFRSIDIIGYASSKDIAEVVAACANLTCTYYCNGSSFVRVRGQSPYYLDDHYSCECPDSFIEKLSQHDMPCSPTSQPKEYTAGMIFSSVKTTSTTTTSSTTTTTVPVGACCGYYQISGTYGCFVVTEAQCAGLSMRTPGIYHGDWTTCEDGTCIGACCSPRDLRFQGCYDVPYSAWGNRCPADYYLGDGTTCWNDGGSCPPNITGACCMLDANGYTSCFQVAQESGCAIDPWDQFAWIQAYYQGDGTTCQSDPCSQTTTTTTTTTSSTTTTTVGSTTTTSTTTTTTAATGACCISTFEGGVCSIMTESACASNSPPGAYQGDGTTCSPDPCTSTTTTSSTTTTTAAPTGACCMSGVCSITTGYDCVSSAGTYQGNDTTCSPDPCGSTTTTSSTTTTTAGSSTTTSSTTTTTAQNIGACCYSSSACANVASLEDCINDYSGSYAGDGTTCQDTPNPCGY